MIRSRSGAGWAIIIPAFLLGAWFVGSSMLARRANVGVGDLLGGQRGSPVAGQRANAPARVELPAVAESMDDGRLASLRTANESWRTSAMPRRVVVDQVCLVPDLPTFLEAMGAWDERHYFPILIDEPGWTLPFLRSFRPSRVVRYAGRTHRAGSNSDASESAAPYRGESAWLRATEAVRRACSTPPAPDQEASAPGSPGLVLADPEAPTIGAAVALAAGHRQPMLRLGPFRLPPGAQGAAQSSRRLGNVLTLIEAWGFARNRSSSICRRRKLCTAGR